MLKPIRKSLPSSHRYYVADATHEGSKLKFGLIHAYSNVIIGKEPSGYPRLMSCSGSITFNAFFKLAEGDRDYMDRLLAYKGNKVGLYDITVTHVTLSGIKNTKVYSVRAKTRFEATNLTNRIYTLDEEVFNKDLKVAYVSNVKVLINKEGK